MKKILALVAAVVMVAMFLVAPAHSAGLSKGIVVFTFDDGRASLYKYVLPLLKKYKLPATAYVLTGPAYSGTEYVTSAQRWELYQNGVEIGNHSHNHLHWATLSDDQIRAEIVDCWNSLLAEGILMTGAFTPPFGDPYDYGVYPGLYERMVSIFEEAGFVTSSRVPWDDTDIFNDVGAFDRFKINSYQLTNSRQLATIKALMNEAVSGKKVLVFSIHDVLPSGGDLNLSLLTSVVQYAYTLKGQGKIEALTISQMVSKMLHAQSLP